MQVSSPLAAMRPSGLCSTQWGEFRPQQRRNNSARPAGSGLFGPPLGGKAASYFDMGSHFDSSPTSSLVADISSNFYIGRTPQMPTPRRSLFTDFTFNAERTMLTPVSASSPTNMDDSMDISPLPHKAPFAKASPPRPSPSASDDDDMMICSSPPVPTAEPVRKTRHERKKSGSFTRPSLSRARMSTNGGITKTSSLFDSTPPTRNIPALFGNANSQTIDLDEMFQSSPQSDRKAGNSPDLFGTPVPRMKPLQANSFDGSPISLMTRKPFPRPKNKVRRTLSMFENAQDVVNDGEKEIAASLLGSSELGSGPGENNGLPSFQNKEETLRRIEKSVLLDVLSGAYNDKYDEIYVVDCRFEYEYQGGHVAGAINVNNADALDKAFFREPKQGRVLVIFHCEYSAHRAPRMANELRKRDRQLNMHRYPALFYPDVYILDGGYSAFFMEHGDKCEPQAYVGMNDDSHKNTCEREMGKFRRNTKFGRSQTYTFGAHGGAESGSPIANVTRRVGRECSDLTGMSLGGTARRLESRRAVSY